MRTRLLAFSVIPLFLLAAGLLVFAIPARAQSEHCDAARVVDLDAEFQPMGLREPDYILLHWSLDINPWPQDYTLDESHFRVDRRRANGGS